MLEQSAERNNTAMQATADADLDSFIAELKEDGQKPFSANGLSRAWKILGKVGSGKFASVYQAQMPQLPKSLLPPGSFIAVKKVMILQMLRAQTREKCLKEIHLLERMNHANVVRYYDSFISPEEELVIVLEWAGGGDLKKLIRAVQKVKRVFSERQVWKYCMEISAGLRHMHDKRVLHRDLKPANIMLTTDNVVKLADLGLSQSFEKETRQAFGKIGTPLYMSPEVFSGRGYGLKADIWSLGCVAYELCTLRSPFKPEKAGNVEELFKKIKTGEYEEIPSTLNYSSDLKDFISKMLQVDAEKRPNMRQVNQMATIGYHRLATNDRSQYVTFVDSSDSAKTSESKDHKSREEDESEEEEDDEDDEEKAEGEWDAKTDAEIERQKMSRDEPLHPLDTNALAALAFDSRDTSERLALTELQRTRPDSPTTTVRSNSPATTAIVTAPPVQIVKTSIIQQAWLPFLPWS